MLEEQQDDLKCPVCGLVIYPNRRYPESRRGVNREVSDNRECKVLKSSVEVWAREVT